MNNQIPLLILVILVVGGLFGYRIWQLDGVQHRINQLNRANIERGTVFGGVQEAQEVQRFRYVKPPRYDVEIANHNYIVGPRNAPLQLVAFTDPLCGRCVAEVEHAIKSLEQYQRNLVVIYKFLPQDPKQNDGGLFAQMAMELGLDEVFWQALPTLRYGDNPTGALVELLEQQGVPLEQIRQTLATDIAPWLEALEQDRREAHRLEINQPTAFFFNGYRLDGRVLTVDQLPTYAQNLMRAAPLWGDSRGVPVADTRPKSRAQLPRLSGQ